jgi:hypothetical protein
MISTLNSDSDKIINYISSVINIVIIDERKTGKTFSPFII